MRHAPLPLLVLAASLLLIPPAGAEPIAPPPRADTAPDHPWDLRKLTLDLDIDPAAGTVAGTATFDITPLAPGIDGRRPFVLDQVALTIEEVTRNGGPVPWRVIADELVIDADEGGAADARIVVRYRATPRNGLHFRRPEKGSPDTYVEAWSQGEGEDNRYWFPGYDRVNDRFVYEGNIRGRPGDKVLTNSGMDLVNYLVMVAVGPYDVHGDEVNSVWVPPGTPREALVPILDPIPAMRAWFGERTGVAYPWGPYRQVIVQRFLYGGMENTSATIESSRLLAGPVNQPVRPGSESVVAHELAHQWYGDLLTCRDWHQLWLNEGFATFFAADWMAFGRGAGGAERWAQSVRGLYSASLGVGSLTGAFYLGKDVSPNAGVYVKGASVLSMLRDMLGEEAFWEGIRAYTTAHQKGLVATFDLQRAMEDASGQNLTWFFRQWTELPYVPRLTSSWSWSPTGTVEVRLTQETGGARPAYTLPIRVEVGDGDPTHTRTTTAWMTGGELTVQVPTTTAPTWVAVDPRGGLLVDLAQQQSPEQWAAQLAGSPSPYARLVAAEQLGKVTGAGAPVAASALATALTSPTTPDPIRMAAATALGEARAPAALLTTVGDAAAPPLVRLEAANALASAARVEDAATLARLRGEEPTADIRAALHRALAAVDRPRGASIARQVLRASPAVPGFDAGAHDAEYRVAADTLGENGDPGDLALLLAAPVSLDRRARGLTAATRIVSRLQLGPAREAARKQVARSAESLLDDLDLRGRQTAVNVLREVGDADSITRLERFRREEEIPSLVDAARDAITAIRGRSDAVTPPAPNEVEARLRALEERQKELEDQATKWMGG